MYLCSPIPRCHDGINPCNRGTANIRGVAQLASASGLGPEGPVFESQYPDIETETDSPASVETETDSPASVSLLYLPDTESIMSNTT